MQWFLVLWAGAGIFTHNHLKGVDNGLKGDNIHLVAVLWVGMPCKCQGQTSMARVVQDDGGTQKTISEQTARQVLKQIGYRSRGPHQVPFLSPVNRELMLHTCTGSTKLDN